MSRELRIALSVFGSALLLLAVVLAFLPVSVAEAGRAASCGGPVSQSALVKLYPSCVPALESRGLLAALAAVVGVGVLAAVGYFALRRTPSTDQQPAG